MSKKKRKSVLPKRIAGVKVPKAVRKGRFGELLTSKAGQALIAEALMAAAAVAGAKKAKDSPKVRGALHDAAETVRDAGHDKGEKAGAASAAFTYALGEAVRSFAGALRDGGPKEHATPDPQPQWRPAPTGPLNGADSEKKSQDNYEAGPL